MLDSLYLLYPLRPVRVASTYRFVFTDVSNYNTDQPIRRSAYRRLVSQLYKLYTDSSGLSYVVASIQCLRERNLNPCFSDCLFNVFIRDLIS
jgi:hypothetical protein